MPSLDRDVDPLFTLPLAEFTSARNALATRLKREGHAGEADQVKALAKPSISAWAVNQLYWKHRELFDRLLETSGRYREAQAAQLSGKASDLRTLGDARRGIISELSQVAAALLQEAGHNPTPDILRRIGTTLEALSAYASIPDSSRPGRLIGDMEAPGFDALTALVSGNVPARPHKPVPLPVSQSTKSSSGKPRTAEERHRSEVAEAKAALRDAERNLSAARAKGHAVLAALKEATDEAKKAEKDKIKAEEHFRKAKAAFEDASKRAASKEAEARDAGKLVEQATRAVEEASRKVESLLRD